MKFLKNNRGRFFVLITFACLLAYAGENATCKKMLTIDEVTDRLNKSKNFKDIPIEERREMVVVIDKSFDSSQKAELARINAYVQNVLKKSSWLSSYDMGNPQMEERVLHKMILECLCFSESLTLQMEFDLIMRLPIGINTNLDVDGKFATGEQWRKLRIKILEHRLHFWRRLNEVIDPNWDPKKNLAMLNVWVPGVEVSGMAPECVKDPVVRKEYEAAIEANRKKAAKQCEQSDAISFRKSYLRYFKYAISDLYSIGPVSKDDMEILQAYLRIYIADVNLRAEIYEFASNVSEKCKNK